MILTAKSFEVLRQHFGKLTQAQVDGFNFLVRKMKEAGFTYPEAAYGLATTWHETDKKMQPISEYGSKRYFLKYDTGTLAKRLGNTQALDGDGELYKGRGYVQITGDDNYDRVGKLIGINLISDPERTLEPEVAAKILTGGMLSGWFTGVGFRRKRPVSRYDHTSYVRARAIINGTDKAKEIADIAMIMEKALRS